MATDEFSDELFESMTPSGGQAPASQQLRDAVLSQTTRTVRNRRRMRRGGLAAALMACYLGGVATMSFWPDHRSAGSLASSAVDSAENVDQVSERDGRKLVRPEDDQIADVSVLSRYERLCRTGDQQLEEYDDIQAAIRSYKKALQLASADQRNIAPERDSWLLMALKQSIN